MHWALRSHSARKVVLLAASYWFYASWDWHFLFLIIGSSVVDYVVGLLLEEADGLEEARARRRRKLLLTVSLVFNLGALAFFKYFNFFVDSAVAALQQAGIDIDTRTLDIILPVGISFYTFQTLSYTIDVYRRQIRPTRSILDFFLFVAFFPQLVAGPVVRARDFLPQLLDKKHLRADLFFEGIERFMIGLFKKLMIADTIGSFVDTAYADVQVLSSQEVLCAAIGFCYQIYADFSGYSDMAIGLALMLGYRLPVNFRLPYLSLSITDYWRRWHISLSSWFRDYLYIPLGGNRHGVVKTYRNLITTFLLTGLWHGANWTFVMFGAWNGAILILERWWRFAKQRLGIRAPGGVRPLLVPVCWLLASASTIVSFIFFRADDMSHAIEILERLGGFHPGYGIIDDELNKFWFVTLLVAVHHGLSALRVRERLRASFPDLYFLRAFLYTAYILLMLSFAPFDERPFIYFQF